MSEEEKMVKWWTLTLMHVLRGYTLAIEAMELAGEEKKIVEVSYEEMRHMMHSHPLEQKQLLSAQLHLLCGLANES